MLNSPLWYQILGKTSTSSVVVVVVVLVLEIVEVLLSSERQDAGW